MRRTIRLTESDLRRIISEEIKNVMSKKGYSNDWNNNKGDDFGRDVLSRGGYMGPNRDTNYEKENVPNFRKPYQDWDDD